jgi:UDP-N-acetylglucosamine:LPS N-acetylglucosamine transferase
MTIAVGRNRRLESKLGERLNRFGDRVRVLGWTNEMPQLLMSHHLLIGKAGGALVQETIAARCPMIVNQVIPGQEEGNAKLIESLGAGAVAGNAAEVPMLVRDAFANGGRKWLEWRENLRKASTSDASLRLADLVLNECDAVEDDQDRINKRLNGLRPAFAGRNEARSPAVAD